MRKIRRTAVCLLLFLSLVSCGGPGSRQNGTDASPESPLEEPDKTPPTRPEKVDTPIENDVEEAEDEELPEEAEGIDPAVVSAQTYTFTQEEYDQVVSDVLSGIVTDDMTTLQKARAVYDYTRSKIRYTGSSDKTDWKQGAYDGMTTRAGDCYTYYAVSRALLTALDIDNLEVQRAGGSTSHYWNLVDCGDGWYHFDATPRSNKLPAFDSFMFTDEEAANYTARAGHSYYVFDGSLYPARAGGDASSDPAVPAKGHAGTSSTPVDTGFGDAVSVETADPPDGESAAETVGPPEAEAGEPSEPEANEPTEPEPSLPEGDIPFEAGPADPEPEPPVDLEIPDWLAVADPAGDAGGVAEPEGTVQSGGGPDGAEAA